MRSVAVAAIGVAALCWVILTGCSAAPTKSHTTGSSAPVKIVPPRPGADFPNPESFYPLEPKRRYIEGTAILHFCTDATGHLSDTPTIDASSGNADLDSAAVLLATAGNGHYLPASRAGAAVAGCGKFGVRFVMFRDPRWPAISAHILNADARMVEALQAWSRDWSVAAPLPAPITAADQLAFYREAGRKAAGGLGPLQLLLEQYLGGIDSASAAPDVSAQEREAFLAEWEPQRARLQQALADAGSELSGLVSLLHDKASFLETLPPDVIPDTLKGKQSARWLALMDRGRVLSEQFNATMRRIQVASPNRPAHLRTEGPEAAGQ